MGTVTLAAAHSPTSSQLMHNTCADQTQHLHQTNYDRGLRTATARSRHHLLADRSRGPVMGSAHQDQSRNAGAPCGGRKPPAARIERGRRAEVGHAIARDDTWPHCPERRYCAARPAQERDAVLIGPALPLQPVTRGGRIGYTLTVTANLAFAHSALGPEPARREAVDKENGEPLS